MTGTKALTLEILNEAYLLPSLDCKGKAKGFTKNDLASSKGGKGGHGPGNLGPNLEILRNDGYIRLLRTDKDSRGNDVKRYRLDVGEIIWHARTQRL